MKQGVPLARSHSSIVSARRTCHRPLTVTIDSLHINNQDRRLLLVQLDRHGLGSVLVGAHECERVIRVAVSSQVEPILDVESPVVESFSREVD